MKINTNFLDLKDSYLFSTIAKKIKAYQEQNPGVEIYRLGIGDVTMPLVPAVIKAIHEATDEMSQKATFRRASYPLMTGSSTSSRTNHLPSPAKTCKRAVYVTC